MNKTQLIGYLGKDPEVKEFATGNMLATLRMATHTKMKNRPEGTEDPYRTTWHTVKVWGRERIEKIVNHFIKGSHVMVEGTIEYRNYISKSGEKKYVTEINAYSLMNLDR
jgi:single-strand DNA-binding protein